MAAIRSFVAVELGDQVKQRLAEIQRQLKATAPSGSVRWVQPDSIHLTLKFLGDVPEERIGALVAALERTCAPVAPLAFVVAGAGCFPDARRPNVVWIGVEDASGQLRALQQAVEQALNPLGYPPEGRPFKPHLTLGRANRSAPVADLRKVGELVSRLEVGRLGQVEVAEIVLMRSDLSPAGARYTPLAHIPLRGAGA
jgi:2'-5' RNA ligase